MISGPSCSGSSKIGWKVPDVNSSLVETACLARRSDFGVKMISGRVRRLNTCQRRRWKYDAGVLGIATVMLS